MTRKNSKVNPKAGTLKQQDRALRTNGQSGFVKSIAFALLLSFSIPSFSIANEIQGDTGMEIKSRVDNSIPDSCCVADKSQNKRDTYKIVRLSIPSKEMIRKSDSEANHNLVRSLKESKLNYLRQWILRSDLEISKRFAAETRINKVGNELVADQEMSIYFDAENLPVEPKAVLVKSDQDINDLFVLENEGLRFAGLNSLEADQDIHEKFELENTRITVPSAAQYVVADLEMSVPVAMSTHSLVSNSKY
jgi:hemerythrin